MGIDRRGLSLQVVRPIVLMVLVSRLLICLLIASWWAPPLVPGTWVHAIGCGMHLLRLYIVIPMIHILDPRSASAKLQTPTMNRSTSVLVPTTSRARVL